MTLVEYNPFEEIRFSERFEEIISEQCWLYISELKRLLECESDEMIQSAFTRALRTMLILDIPVRYHIKEIYRTEDEGVCVDYRLSSLAIYLTIINTEPVNPIIARAQLYFVTP